MSMPENNKFGDLVPLKAVEVDENEQPVANGVVKYILYDTKTKAYVFTDKSDGEGEKPGIEVLLDVKDKIMESRAKDAR